jgi:hypothetical protein
MDKFYSELVKQMYDFLDFVSVKIACVNAVTALLMVAEHIYFFLFEDLAILLKARLRSMKYWKSFFDFMPLSSTII